MTNDRIRPMGGDGGRRPVAGFAEKIPLDDEGIALMKEVHALYLKRLEERREEGDESPDAQLYWEGGVEPDFSGLSEAERKEAEARIEGFRTDPEWRARLKRRLEESAPDLARLMEIDPPDDAE